jgi:hypothetical protein
VASPDEKRILQEIVDSSELQNIATALKMHQPGTELGTVLHTYTSSLKRTNTPIWHTPVTIILGAITVLHVLHKWIYPLILKQVNLSKLKRTQTAPSEQPTLELSTVELTASIRYAKHTHTHTHT